MPVFILATLLFLTLSSAYSQNISTLDDPAKIRKADTAFFANDWKTAKALYESVSDKTLFGAASYSRLGFSNYNLGLYSEAMNQYQEVLTINTPQFVRGLTFSRIAKVYAMKKDTKKAIEYLDSAANNSYSNVPEMDTLPDFKSIRNLSAFKVIKKKINDLVLSPCMQNKHAREFDFWIGEWDVYIRGTKNKVGHSIIQRISNGCAILENWDTPSSGNGKSINFIDPNTNKWKQSWVGSNVNGIQEFVDGEYEDGAMRFTFERKTPQGKKLIGHFVFYNEGPGQVRQFNETSIDGGKTWVVSYDYTYLAKK